MQFPELKKKFINTHRFTKYIFSYIYICMYIFILYCFVRPNKIEQMLQPRSNQIQVMQLKRNLQTTIIRQTKGKNQTYTMVGPPGRLGAEAKIFTYSRYLNLYLVLGIHVTVNDVDLWVEEQLPIRLIVVIFIVVISNVDDVDLLFFFLRFLLRGTGSSILNHKKKLLLCGIVELAITQTMD